MIEDTLFTRLTTFAGLAALISNRAYPLRLPQNPQLPAVVYQRISGPRLHAHDGASGTAYPRFQIRVWATQDTNADGYTNVRTVAQQVRLALDGYKLSPIQSCLLMDERDDEDLERDFQGSIMDFQIWHDE